MPTLPGKPPAVHVYSDGNTRSTIVIGPDGQKIPNVRKVEIMADAATGEFQIELTLHGGVIDIDGSVRAVVFHCPICDTEEGTHHCLGS